MKDLEATSVPAPPRYLAIGLFVLAAISLIGDALFAPYATDSDVVSYFDLADQIQGHHWTWVVNSYWNPLYPGLLAAARSLMHADVWHEMFAGRLLNFVIALLVLLASVYLADSALRLSLSQTDAGKRQRGLARIPRRDLLVAAFLVTYWLIVRNLALNTIRPDLSLSLFLIVGFAALFNIVRDGGLRHFALLGAGFGLAYLIKSIAFPLFVFALLVLTVLAIRTRFYFKGIALTILVFAIIAGPYIFALSKKVGHFSSGESGADNYAWYVDGAARFEPQHGRPEMTGSAIDQLTHTATELLSSPPVYYYGNWMPGTETQWFEPSYWNTGLKPKFVLSRQVSVSVSNIIALVRVCLQNVEVFLPFALISVLGGSWAISDWRSRGLGPVAITAAALIGFYMVIRIEGRLVVPVFFVLFIGALAFAYLPANVTVRAAFSYSLLMLLAAMVLTDFTGWARSMREQKEEQGTALGAYNREMWSAAHALISGYGIQPGDTVACYGEGACRDDLTWARLSKANVRTEVYCEQPDVLSEWEKSGNNPDLIPKLQSTGAKVLVAKFSAGLQAPPGWTRLGRGDLFVVDLRPARALAAR